MRHKNLNSILLSLAIVITAFHDSQSQNDTILQHYISQGLESNHALKQKHTSYEKSLKVLKEAWGLFLPDISFNARYSFADGGRTIELPIGDLMNPVYESLNSITSFMALDPFYPPDAIFPDTSINNEYINFLRSTEHETKLRLVQPLFNTQIWYNYKIKSAFVEVERIDAEVYKRQLIAEIKTAYFNYLKTVEVLELIKTTEILLQENIRTTTRLYENDKVTFDAVLQTQAELSKLKQEEASQIKNHQLAKAYFNFLINRTLSSEIIISQSYEVLFSEYDLEQLQQQAINNREELQQLSVYKEIAINNVQMNTSNRYPSLAAVIDYGYQGEKYNFSSEDDFVMASFVLQWDLFKGMQNHSKIQQAKLDQQILDEKYLEAEKQIKLQVISAYYDLEASAKAIQASRDEMRAMKQAYKIIGKKYAEGMSNLLEYTKARSDMTMAEQNYIINKYNHQVILAHFDQVTGINQY